MKTPYKNIYTVLRYNRIVVLTLVTCTTLLAGYAFWSVYRMHRQSLDHAFMIDTEGSVIPLVYQAHKENFEVEVLNHLQLFHRYFYNLEAGSYKKNLEKALWLGDQSIDQLYRQKKTDGIYNRLLQYNLVQKVIQIDSEITLENEQYSFETVTLFEINRGSQIDRYRLETSGHLISVDRNFPHNPHGLLVTDFYESSLQKLKN